MAVKHHLALLSIVMASARASPLSPRADCSCGYTLSNYDNTYFTTLLSVDFSTLGLSGTATSSSWLEDAGVPFYIANGYAVSAQSSAPDHTTPMGDYTNVRINNGILELVVPGGQIITDGGTTSNAQIEGPTGIINGVFTMNAQISNVPGTDQSIFTYHDSDTGTEDEQDVEILSSYLYDAGSNGTPAGIELTNWDPTDSTNTIRDYEIDPFPSDPAAGFNDYTIAWLPSATTYYMNSYAFDSPTEYYSVNPSVIVMNHWTNGDPAFTQGPPTEDAVMQISSFQAYYSLSGATGLPNGCSESEVCAVTA